MIEEKPIIFNTEMVRAILEGWKTQTRRVMKRKFEYGVCIKEKNIIINCPYGKIGDKLWVRETFKNFNDGDTYFKADFKNKNIPVHADDKDFKWKPSIFMLKEHARIWLEILNIRIEKLQDITELDAKAEGIKNIESFKILWDSLNKKRGFGWEKNSYVWVIEFKRIGNQNDFKKNYKMFNLRISR